MFLCSLCRAKLAEWMASKGKTFKRPARATAELSKTNVSAKPAADLKPKSQPAAHSKPEPRLEHKPDSAAAAHRADTPGAAPTHDRTPLVMNTTLDLLEDSDAGLPGDPQGSVDDVRKPAAWLLLKICFTVINVNFFDSCLTDRPEPV